MLGIPAIRDRVVQGALKLILEPIFEADFHEARTAIDRSGPRTQAVDRVAEAIVRNKTRVIDVDLRAYFDNVRHDRLLAEGGAPGERRRRDALAEADAQGIRQARGSPGRRDLPLLSNIYLTEVDGMLERAKEVTRHGKYTSLEYARYADDLVILVDGHRRQDWLLGAVNRRLREEFAKLDVEVNEEKSRIVDLTQGESFGFLGFDFRRVPVSRERGGRS